MEEREGEEHENLKAILKPSSLFPLLSLLPHPFPSPSPSRPYRRQNFNSTTMADG